MSSLSFEIIGAEPDKYAATPLINFRLRLTEASGAEVHSISLRAQIRIEPQRRRYTQAEEERLLAMFGETPQWGQTLRPFLWSHAQMMVPGFTGTTEVDLPVAFSYDFEVAGAKYMHSLEDGEIPLLLLFNGTTFARTEAGTLSVDPVAWNLEAGYRLPVLTWRRMMDAFFPGSGWIRIQRDTLDALERYKTVGGFTTWESAFATLLKHVDAAEGDDS